jgi:hypothetical protein
MSIPSERIAYHFLGRDPTEEEKGICCITPDRPEPPLQFDPDFDPSKRDMLLHTACQAYHLRHYLKKHEKFYKDFNIHITLVHVMLLKGMCRTMPELMKVFLSRPDLVITNKLLGEYEPLDISNYRGPDYRRVIKFAPPTCNALWPVAVHWGNKSIDEDLAKGKSRKQILAEFDAGTFNPCFEWRWDWQMARLRTREQDCEIQFADFCERNVSKVKLWFTENHPSHNLMAFIGSEFLRLAGYDHDTEEAILALPSDELGTWNAHPETKYEWEYYKMQYPMKYQDVDGGLEFYRELILGGYKAGEVPLLR